VKTFRSFLAKSFHVISRKVLMEEQKTQRLNTKTNKSTINKKSENFRDRKRNILALQKNSEIDLGI
jgi:hypothetical protein